MPARMSSTLSIEPRSTSSIDAATAPIALAPSSAEAPGPRSVTRRTATSGSISGIPQLPTSTSSPEPRQVAVVRKPASGWTIPSASRAPSVPNPDFQPSRSPCWRCDSRSVCCRPIPLITLSSLRFTPASESDDDCHRPGLKREIRARTGRRGVMPRCRRPLRRGTHHRTL